MEKGDRRKELLNDFKSESSAKVIRKGALNKQTLTPSLM
jgi:hypothetical protein